LGSPLGVEDSYEWRLLLRVGSASLHIDRDFAEFNVDAGLECFGSTQVRERGERR
jgi:hypothetical protein